MRNYGLYSVIVAISLLACQREDPRVTEILARLDKIDRHLDALERRPGPAAAPPARRRPDPNTVYNVPVAAGDIQKGARAAKVTIVEGFDFACPYCAASRPMVEAVLAKYKDSVRVVPKAFVVHPQIATLPALAVCAAQLQGKGAAMDGAIWARAWKTTDGRPRFDRTQLAEEALEKIAAGEGLDVAKLKADMQSPACRATLARQQRELATVGVHGTPAFFINGKPYSGPRSVEGFTAAVEAEVKKADAAIRSGVKLDDYYATIMKNARKSL